MKIFYKWEDVWNVKETMFILVDNNFKFDEKNNHIKPFSKLKNPISGDYVDLTSKDIMIYISFKKEDLNTWQNKEQNKEKINTATYIFKKNKLYDFNGGGSGGGRNIRFFDEIGHVIDDYHDIWYDPFVFVYERDLKQFDRFLKIKELNGIT